MNDELRKRISDALDRPGGIESDAGLVDVLARDPEAAAYARSLRRLDRALRRWPPLQRTDESWEALAQRIEQRLDEKLAPIADPTPPPAFDDDRRDPSGQTRIEGHARDSNLEKLRAIDLKSIPPGPPPPPPGKRDGDGSKAKPLFAAPAPTPLRGEERFSIPDVPQRLSRPFPELAPVDLGAVPARAKKQRRTWLYAGAGASLFAAAAVALLAITVGQENAPDALTMPSESPAAAPVTSVPAVPALPGMVAEPEAAPVDGRSGGQGQGQAIGGSGDGATMWATEGSPPAQAVATTPAARGYAPTPTPAPSSGAPGSATDSMDSLRAGRARRSAGAEQRTVDRTGGGGGTDQGGEEASGGGVPDPRQQSRPRGGGTTTATQGGAGGGGGGGGGESGPTGEGGGDAPVEALPEVPDRAAVRDALQAVQPAIRDCAQGAGGVANITITVASTGRVTNALVTGQYAGTPQGSCMARAARAARFPRFSRPTMQVTYPFQL